MCYAKPGPRCSAHAKASYLRAKQHISELPLDVPAPLARQAQADYEKAREDFLSTPAGFKALEKMARDAEAAGEEKKKNKLLDEINSRRGERKKAIAAVKSTSSVYSPDDITTWTPVNVDEAEADVMDKQYKLDFEEAMLTRRLKSAHEELDPNYRYMLLDYQKERAREDIVKINGKLTELTAQREVLDAQEQTYEEEYERRGGWTRAFVVAKGHVHSSRSCSSCYPSTQYSWVTGMSGKSEDDVIDAAGERACTVCYPNAPTDVLNRPTRVFTPDEEQAQRNREEAMRKRVERAAAKDAKSITAPDGSKLEISHNGWKDRITTLSAARIAYVDNLIKKTKIDAGQTEYINKEAPQNVSILKAALLAKTGQDEKKFDEEMSKKATIKVRKEQRERAAYIASLSPHERRMRGLDD